MNGVQVDHGLRGGGFGTYSFPYLRNSLSMPINIDMTKCVVCRPKTTIIIRQIDATNFDGGRPILDNSTTDSLVFFGVSINFIDT